MTFKPQRDRNSVVKEQGFYMLSKLSLCKCNLECYNFRVLNMILVVTTKNTIYTKGNEKEI